MSFFGSVYMKHTDSANILPYERQLWLEMSREMKISKNFEEFH